MNNNLEILETTLQKLKSDEHTIYFLVYDTKNNARASVKHIYDMALTLKENGLNVKLLTEDKTYEGVSAWLGDKYNTLETLSIKEDQVQIKLEDMIVIPEYYSNVLQQLSNVRCNKIMLVQQVDYIFETLPIGSKWTDYGFDKVITTSENAKKYILEYFPNSLVYLIPPIIEDVFSPSTEPLKPYVAISCRNRNVSRKLISQFYLKYPQLRWITFRDMVQMSNDEFAAALKECVASLWVDDESTFGTFPLESMKCGVPIIGKIPNMDSDYIGENGMWTYDENKLVDILGTYILAWLEGIELTEDIKTNMKETLKPYDKMLIQSNIISIFTSMKNKRIEGIEKTLEKLKQEVA